MGEARKEGEKEEGLLLLMSLALALSGGVSAVLPSVRTEPAPSGALVQSHSKAVSSAFCCRCRCSYPVYVVIESGLRVIVLMTFHVE